MYLGRIAEIADRDDISTTRRRHPYTQSLLSAVPVADPRHVSEPSARRRIILQGRRAEPGQFVVAWCVEPPILRDAGRGFGPIAIVLGAFGLVLLGVTVPDRPGLAAARRLGDGAARRHQPVVPVPTPALEAGQ
jgi:ABC-type glutathione transport system ATPase component